MRSGFLAFSALSLVVGALGCARTLPPTPGVAVIGRAKATSIDEVPAADEDEPADGDPDADYVIPCKEGSVALHAAELTYEAFQTKVRALPIQGDPKPLERELEKLLEHPCFELASADPKEPLTFPNALSLQHWWSEGGADWLFSYLRVEQHRYLRVAPTPRLALTVETAPKDHPLAPLLCPADLSKPCATESKGWTQRAHEKLELLGGRHRRGPDEIDCQEEAKKEPKADRYATYRNCLERGFVAQQALPIGRFKAPSDGWLVMSDDHVSCRTVVAFHLVTGSAYSASDCGGATRTLVGRVPVGALREAAWMLVLAPETQANVRFTQGFYVPDRIPIMRTRYGTIGLGMIGCSCGTSSRHSWSWMRESANGVLRGQVSGVVRGRGDDDAIRHAFDLLDVATAAREEGCAPSPPPARIAWSSAGPSSREGEAAVIDDPPSEPVRLALLKAKPSRTCTVKP